MNPGPQLPPYPDADPDETPSHGPGQDPEAPFNNPGEYPDTGAPSEIPPLDPGFPGMPPLTD